VAPLGESFPCASFEATMPLNEDIEAAGTPHDAARSDQGELRKTGSECAGRRAFQEVESARPIKGWSESESDPLELESASDRKLLESQPRDLPPALLLEPGLFLHQQALGLGATHLRWHGQARRFAPGDLEPPASRAW
jgi:hypothetical protein